MGNCIPWRATRRSLFTKVVGVAAWLGWIAWYFGDAPAFKPNHVIAHSCSVLGHRFIVTVDGRCEALEVP